MIWYHSNSICFNTNNLNYICWNNVWYFGYFPIFRLQLLALPSIGKSTFFTLLVVQQWSNTNIGRREFVTTDQSQTWKQMFVHFCSLTIYSLKVGNCKHWTSDIKEEFPDPKLTKKLKRHQQIIFLQYSDSMLRNANWNPKELFIRQDLKLNTIWMLF